jgi:hypothetical protein
VKIKNIWNKTLFFQSLIISFVYQVFLFFGMFYAGLGMDPEYANIILAIVDIPFELIRLVERIYCYDSSCLTKTDSYNDFAVLLISIIFSAGLFYIIGYVSKLKIRTINLFLLSIVFGFLCLALIDIVLYFLR